MWGPQFHGAIFNHSHRGHHCASARAVNPTGGPVWGQTLFEVAFIFFKAQTQHAVAASRNKWHPSRTFCALENMLGQGDASSTSANCVHVQVVFKLQIRF